MNFPSRMSKRVKSEENSDSTQGVITSDEIISFILKNKERGGPDIDEWLFAIQSYNEEKKSSDMKDNVTSKLRDNFKGTPIELLLPSVKISSFSLDSGDDWRYDRSRMSITFTITWKQGFTFEFQVSMSYSRDDGIECTISCECNSKSKALTDCSGDFDFGFFASPIVEIDDFQNWVNEEFKQKMAVEEAKKLCWLATAIIGEANYSSDFVFKTEEVNWKEAYNK